MAEVRTIAVIGAGIMGRGIAHAAALGGYRTILEDILPTALRKAETEIRSNLDKAVELGKVTKADADQAFGRLEYASSVEQAAREADLVIEAVPEEMESKIEIFTLLDKVCRPNNHSRFQHLVAERDGNCLRDLSRSEMRWHALLQSCAQNEAAGDCARAGDRRRNACRCRRSRQTHGQGSCGHQGVAGIHHQPHQRHDRQRSLLYAAGRRRLAAGHRQSLEARA